MTEEDPYSPSYISNGVPVFQPSLESFQNFELYLHQIEKFGSLSGICKVIPPKEWKISVPNYAAIVNTKKRYKKGVRDIKRIKLNCSLEHYKPQSNNYEELIRREQLNSIVITKPIKQIFNGSNGIYYQMNIESKKKYSIAEFKDMADSMVSSLHQKYLSEEREYKAIVPSNTDLQNHDVAMVTNFSDSSEDDRFSLKIDESVWEEMEKLYWKILPFNETFYGADLPGSLFPSIIGHWNISHLPGILNLLKKPIPGVNTPYLYFGTWKATFAWHVEDMDLFSINYLHFGTPKQWYAIPPPDKGKFEKLAKGYFEADYRNCDQFLRHKTTVISPSILAKAGINVHKIRQHPGEFVITFPYGYHQGFNYGFNCAEAVNFALPSWIEKGIMADYCQCLGDNVRIDVLDMIPEILSIYKDKISISPTIQICLDRKRSSSNAINDKDPPDRPRKKSEISIKSDQKQDQAPKIKVVMKWFCHLCPVSRGKFLATTLEGKFVHAECAEMFTQLSISEDLIVFGLEQISEDYFHKRCMLCHSVEGSYLKCAHPTCTKYFHIPCARNASLLYPSLKRLFCAVHDPVNQKKENLIRAYREWERAKIGTKVHIRQKAANENHGRSEGRVKEVSIERKSCLIIFDNPEGFEWIKWKNIDLTDQHPATPVKIATIDVDEPPPVVLDLVENCSEHNDLLLNAVES